MPTPLWQTLPQASPPDASTVWVQIEQWNISPFLAVWDETSQSFTSVTGSLVLPWYACVRWREQ